MRPREAYAVVSLRTGTREIVVGVELRAGETSEEIYDVARWAIERGISPPVGRTDEEVALDVEECLRSTHDDRAYYIEAGRHSEAVERPEYRYHVQLFRSWASS